MPNTFKSPQGITAATGTKFNPNLNALLNTSILEQPIIPNKTYRTIPSLFKPWTKLTQKLAYRTNKY